MPPKNQNENPIQTDYENGLNATNKAEEKGTMGDPSGGNDSSIKNAEESPINNWKNNVSSAGGGTRGNNTSSTAGNSWKNNVTSDHTGPPNTNVRFSSLKKKGPMAAIIITIFGGGIGIVGMLSPSLLLVQVKEIMVNKFNTQLSSMDVRKTKLLVSKSGTLKGLCTSHLNVGCRYGTMSKKQIKNFEKAGIKVHYDDKSLFGRAKPTSFEFEGKKMNPSEFKNKITKRESTSLRAALNKAYNPKFAGFTDAIWVKAANILKISKKAPTFEGENYDEKMKNLEKNIQDTTGLKKAGNVSDDDIDPNSTEGKTYGEEGTTEATNNRINEFNSLIDEAGGDGSTASKILSGVDEISGAIKITGVVDDGCTFYRTFRSIGYAAKTVRVMQLAYYAMMFLNVADQIKAGTAKADDVAFLSTVLTKTSNDDNETPKSATNSFGYNYAESGKVGVMPTSSMQFMAAAGLSGVMVNFFDSFPKSLKTTCKVLGNPVVGFASLVGGAALLVFSGGTSLSLTAAKTALKHATKEALTSPGFWASTGLAFAEVFLPGLLKDIVAGNLIDKSTVGANAGDAITSGASGIMGTVAKTGGNAPLNPEQAVAYNNLSNEIANQYAEEDRLAYSPLDASNSNTFMGKIIGQLAPYASNMSSLSGIFSSIASITTGSFASLTSQTTKAASTNEYSMCQDYEYRKLNLATDPFCNVMYGIPPEALDGDPIEIASTLIAAGQIDSETGDPIADSDYAKFVTNCIDRTTPLGDDSSESEGSECLFSDANKNYYIHYIDQRVQTGLDDEETTTSSTTPTDPSPGVGNTDIDYTDNGADVPCAAGTTGTTPATQTGYYANDNGNIRLTYGGSAYRVSKVKVRTCHVGAAANKPVNSQISASVLQMLKDNNKLKIFSGFRDMALQTSLWFQNGQNPEMVAEPGTSNHQMGIAMDLGCGSYTQMSTGDSCFTWLKANASKYGFKNYAPEPWHWSVTGS